ncbi:hypothetical protein [Serratia aquatilis]|uniref:Uncharacterized protein n=1 Tax=Serratia aquatilis TaxID=1737515 RepID=A0ABV6E9W7_9GAMM
MTDKKTIETKDSAENATLLKILGRLLSVLDASISGKDRSVLVAELSNINLDGVPEAEKNLASELVKRALLSLDH